MKKLSLKKFNLNPNNQLQRDQLKAVYGGYDWDIDPCQYFKDEVCYSDNDCPSFCGNCVIVPGFDGFCAE